MSTDPFPVSVAFPVENPADPSTHGRGRPRAVSRRVRKPCPSQGVAVTVLLSPRMRTGLRHMANARHATEADALRDALAIGLLVERQRRSGGRLIIRHPNGDELTL